jgi:hypothetical protein
MTATGLQLAEGQRPDARSNRRDPNARWHPLGTTPHVAGGSADAITRPPRTCGTRAPSPPGLLALDAGDVEAALAHYAAGVWVAEQSLSDPFDGVPWWGWVDDRPFCAACTGLMISAWRLGDLEQGETLCRGLLWLNPGDHLGASDLLAKLMAGDPWHP